MDKRFFFLMALLLMEASLVAQSKEDIHANLIGKWAWTETVQTSAKSSNPAAMKVITPESCNCKRRLIITEDQILSEDPSMENAILLCSNEHLNGIADSSSYSIEEYKILQDVPVKIFIRSDILDGEIVMIEDSSFSVCQYYCGSTCHYFKRVY